MIALLRRLTTRATLTVGVVLSTAVGCSGDKVVAVSAPTTPPVTRATGPANVLFLLADDLRSDGYSATGNPVLQTPNIDALARSGVAFNNAYVTTPVCAISRATIFTGQWERRHGINDFVTDLSSTAFAQTYPALMRKAGYRSGFIGKFGVGDKLPAQEFDYWRGFPGQGTYEHVDSATGQPIHLTQLQTNQVVEFLRTQPAGQHFVLSVSYKAPHVQDEDPRQFIPDPRDATLLSGATMPTPLTADPKYFDAFPDFFKTNNEARIRWQTLFSTPAKFQTNVKGYYRLVAGLDRSVGEIRTALHQFGFDTNTVIVFFSDNGFMLGEEGLSHKWYGFDPSIRVPLIVYDPRQATARGRVEPAIALNVDLAPTFLDYAGLSAPSTMQGRSLRPLVTGQATGYRTDFLFEHLFKFATIRESAGVAGGRYKYMRYFDPTPNYEMLYDMVADPYETTDLARDPRYQTVLDSLRSRYDVLAAGAR